MTALITIGIDLVAMLVLVFGLYFPRHRRADLVAAFLGVNVGVLAVATVLANSAVSAGLGLGLFGVLSIIRLRSDEITQHEIAYYFASLSIGLLMGMTATPTPLVVGLVALILVALAFGDSRLLFGRYSNQTVQLDRAITEDAALRAALGERLGATVIGTRVIRVDFVNDLTLVDVRFREYTRAERSKARQRQLDEQAGPRVERSAAQQASAHTLVSAAPKP
ncbi:DUF4956 domain-containing protein [Schaalia cardiffensis]|uniref:DUF4956 domain-containing protein n=1 Tax=Schaalia cardiffensis TaxID=181487 RepID=UPI0023F04CE2|nr:DUF4956 domain-containing protein [Schaalia cardiffensis]